MINNPTYEALEKRIKDLEQENRQLSEKCTKIEPEMTYEDMDLKSIINVKEIQSILDDFHYLTNMVTAVLDLNGNIIESTGWQDICTRFHRVNPETAINCTNSDLYLSKKLKPGECVDYKCKNGLWDVVTPLFVEKKHIGNIFTGQFFYDDDEINENDFIKQAEKYGFEKQSYIEAFRRIPRYDRKTIDHLMSFLVKFTTYISKISLINIQLEREIKNRKQSEEALKKSEILFRTITEQSGEGLCLIDAKGKILIANPILRQITGYNDSELPGIHLKDLIAPETEMILFPKVINGQSGSREITLIKKDGSSFLADVRGYPIKLENQNCMLGIISDITDIKIKEQEKRHLEIRIQHSQKMEALGTLAGGIAHDFNNILSSIIGFTELARLNSNEDEETKNNLDEVLSAGLRARDLVKHILAFSRKADAQKNIIQIVPLIKECLKFLKASVPANIDIRHHFKRTGLFVLSDPTQLHQILMNLFTNAAYAMKEKGGTLKVKLDSITIKQEDIDPAKLIIPGRYVQLIISDTGCGIPENLIEKIFEPFFTTKSRMEGTGMGLSTVYGIVKEMKGEITVESELGIGSTFKILIPEQAGETQIQLDDDVKPKTGKGTILLVDDEPAIVKWCSQVLVKLGYQVTGFINSLEALKRFRQDSESFDLILTDLSMPRISGLELVKQIKKIRPDIPAILFTGFSDGLTNEKIQACGISAMVMKPMIASELAQVVDNFLNHKKGRLKK